ncbi:alpha/beta fold hydrolase [Marinobacter changyiensis]|uniref:alpha/beta fold hydrolase n=1 Tax=Marinobacter changyiensis TaxID=2604091 RepID=UPI0012653623|nr:alpha/beta hydrolase [Marinobacter changyiensis]
MQTLDFPVDLEDGVTLQVRHIKHAAEDGPAIVLLHEALGTIALWRTFPARLAEATGRDVLVYERRGYGRSSPEPLPRPLDYLEQEGEVWLPRLLQALGLKDVILLGHSDGGSIALVTAGAVPDQVSGLATMAAHVTVDPLTLHGIRAMGERYRTTDLGERLARHHGERGRLLFDAWQETWVKEAFRQAMNFQPWLSQVRCPALIMQGENDEYGLPQQVTDIVNAIGPHASPVFIPDAGHFPHFEQPERVLALISEFVDSIAR